jgi:hypothetical protein
MRLEDGMGNPLRAFMHGGQTWVLGEPGQRFEIVVTNPTSRRVEAVVSVDGRDAVSGGMANSQRNRGYVIQPGGSVRIDGFRTSLEDVATFRFTSPEASYSARMGTPQNIGVIAVAFFPERERPAVAMRERMAPRAKRSAPSASARRDADGNLGVEFGESRMSRVMEVSFERMSNMPTRVVTIRYDDSDGLLARGIEVFPRMRPIARQSRFAPAPR